MVAGVRPGIAPGGCGTSHPDQIESRCVEMCERQHAGVCEKLNPMEPRGEKDGQLAVSRLGNVPPKPN